MIQREKRQGGTLDLPSYGVPCRAKVGSSSFPLDTGLCLRSIHFVPGRSRSATKGKMNSAITSRGILGMHDDDAWASRLFELQTTTRYHRIFCSMRSCTSRHNGTKGRFDRCQASVPNGIAAARNVVSWSQLMLASAYWLIVLKGGDVRPSGRESTIIRTAFSSLSLFPTKACMEVFAGGIGSLRPSWLSWSLRLINLKKSLQYWYCTKVRRSDTTGVLHVRGNIL